MAQALEKGNMSPKEKIGIFYTKNRYKYSQNSVFDEIQFSQKSLINRKNQPHALPQQVLVQQIPIARSGGTGKRDQNSEGRGAQYQSFQTRYSSFLWYV